MVKGCLDPTAKGVPHPVVKVCLIPTVKGCLDPARGARTRPDGPSIAARKPYRARSRCLVHAEPAPPLRQAPFPPPSDNICPILSCAYPPALEFPALSPLLAAWKTGFGCPILSCISAPKNTPETIPKCRSHRRLASFFHWRILFLVVQAARGSFPRDVRFARHDHKVRRAAGLVNVRGG